MSIAAGVALAFGASMAVAQSSTAGAQTAPKGGIGGPTGMVEPSRSDTAQGNTTDTTRSSATSTTNSATDSTAGTAGAQAAPKGGMTGPTGMVEPKRGALTQGSSTDASSANRGAAIRDVSPQDNPAGPRGVGRTNPTGSANMGPGTARDAGMSNDRMNNDRMHSNSSMSGSDTMNDSMRSDRAARADRN
jgi:hypothetical protein